MKKFAIVCSTVIFFGCQQTPSHPDIVTGIAPIAQLIRDISGDTLTVESIIPADSDPHTFNLRPSDARKIETAKSIVALNNHVDGWVLSLSDREVLILDSNELEHHTEHHHHHDQENNPHTWLSFHHSKILIDRVTAILAVHFPHDEKMYFQNAEQLKNEINQIYALFLEKNTKPAVLQRHAAWDYLLQELNVHNLGALENFEGEQVSFKKLNRLIEQINNLDTEVVLIDDLFSQKSSALDQIAVSTGYRIERFNPMVAPSGSSRISDILKEYSSLLFTVKN